MAGAERVRGKAWEARLKTGAEATHVGLDARVQWSRREVLGEEDEPSEQNK